MNENNENIKVFLEEEKGNIHNDLRTLCDVEDALLHWSDSFEDHWEECDVDLHGTVALVRDLRHRLTELGIGLGSLQKGGVDNG